MCVRVNPFSLEPCLFLLIVSRLGLYWITALELVEAKQDQIGGKFFQPKWQDIPFQIKRWGGWNKSEVHTYELYKIGKPDMLILLQNQIVSNWQNWGYIQILAPALQTGIVQGSPFLMQNKNVSMPLESSQNLDTKIKQPCSPGFDLML